jgi:hypothetical protein
MCSVLILMYGPEEARTLGTESTLAMLMGMANRGTSSATPAVIIATRSSSFIPHRNKEATVAIP